MPFWVTIIFTVLVTSAGIFSAADDDNGTDTSVSPALENPDNNAGGGGGIPETIEGQGSDGDEDLKYMEIHMHPHPPIAKYSTFKTLMRFTYGEDDKLGPHNWDSAPSAILTTNDCPMNKFTPMNINTSMAGLAEHDNSHVSSNNNEGASLAFLASPQIEAVGWEFGFPQDTFNGIAITPKAYGTFQVMDEYDSHEKETGTASRMYDFTYALLTYCDLDRSSPNRSGHQINGERFPLEIHLLFFGFSLPLGIDKTVFGEARNDIIMVSVLGRLSKKDNPSLVPLITAARKFSGSDYMVEFGEDTVQIPHPFSPLTLLPKNSGYFYYKGNFPIPPCFAIPRVYVLQTPISISRKQLSVLTHMKSARETSGVLTCTYGLLPEQLTQYGVQHNPTSIQFNSQKGSESNGASSTVNPFLIISIPFIFIFQNFEN